MYINELEKNVGEGKLVSFPLEIQVKKDDLTNIDRWRKDE